MCFTIPLYYPDVPDVNDMEAVGNKRKAKNKQWYKAQKKRKFSLCPDIKGFLCFCNFREKEAIREAYNILNQHYNEESQVGKNQPDALATGNESEEDEGDIEAQLEREKAALKTEHESSEEQRRFQVVESGVNNVLFIRTTVADPLSLVTRILEGIRDSRKQVTRHLIRMLPVQATCKAYEENVKPTLQTLVDNFVADRPQGESFTKYQVLFKARMNQNLFREDVLKIVQESVRDKNFKVDLKNPGVCFVFEIIKSNCCISLLPNYFQYKKYNLIELAQTDRVESKAAESKLTAGEVKSESNDSPKASSVEGDKPEKVQESQEMAVTNKELIDDTSQGNLESVENEQETNTKPIDSSKD